MKFPSLTALVFAAAVVSAGAPAEAPPESAEGSYSAAGLYNLANSYARAGKPGMAVLNYERAALLAPNDADIQTNLERVRAARHLPAPATSTLERIAHIAGPTTVAAFGILGVLITGASLLAVKLVSRHRAWWIAGACLGLAAIAFTVCNAIFWGRSTHEAVVIASTTPVRATPVPMGDALQDLPEAETVAVIQGHEDFVLIRTALGRLGWVARADLADVVPNPRR